MVGQVIFTGTDGYQEVIEAESGATRLVECSSLNTFPMYRLEYTERGHSQHSTHWTWPEAEANFEYRSQQSA